MAPHAFLKAVPVQNEATLWLVTCSPLGAGGGLSYHHQTHGDFIQKKQGVTRGNPNPNPNPTHRIGCGCWGYRSQHIQLEALYKPHPDIPVQEASVGKREEKIKSSWGWHNRFHSDDRVKDLWFIQQCKNQTSKVILIQKILLSSVKSFWFYYHIVKAYLS